MTINFYKGDRIIINTEAHFEKIGNIRSKNVLQEEHASATVLKITKTKRGRKMHVYDDRGYGYAIIIDDLPDFLTVTAIK